MSPEKTKPPVPNSRPNFPQIEEEILQFWEQEDIFQKSVEQRPEKDKFVFYEGPPFATGLPHYGHLITSIAKDIVPRYQTMKGKRVERKWGWDCHGLPIENIAEKNLKIGSKKDIEEKVGIDKFNQECERQILEYANEWKRIIDRFGRWVDWSQTYLTMDPQYTESVWWTFRQLWDRDRIYEGRRVVPYCYRCETPLSNAETRADDATRPRKDPALTVEFEVRYTKSSRGIGALILNDKKEVLLVHRNESHREKCWAFPGGKVEDGEDFAKTVEREIKEELGIETVSTEPFLSQPQIFEGRLYHTVYFVAKIKGQPEIKVPNELDDLQWFPLDQLPDNLYIPSRDAINIYQSGEKKMFFDLDTEKSLPKISLLAWTTTPWTLPANQLLAINQDEDYLCARSEVADFIFAKSAQERLFSDSENFEIISEFKGKDLMGLKYEPLFPYFRDKGGQDSFQIVAADFVTSDEGTGIVHLAEFGEDDFKLFEKRGISPLDPVDDRGNFKEAITDFAGQNIHEAADNIIWYLKEHNLLFRKETIEHNYPFCWRCDTPLQYRPLKVWFIKVEDMRDRMLQLNQKINWVPDKVKDGRFGKWLEGAKDWLISRNRYWGAPMPVWKCLDKNCDNIFVPGSFAELEKKSGVKISELMDSHRPAIDQHTWSCEKCGGEMRRIPEVLDTWIDSSAMPFAQYHYPFENREKFESENPSDFIVEYINQTRAWFYYLHVISTSLFAKPAFLNVVCHGIVQGNDGRKMSKRLKNYPDIEKSIKEYGVDAMRFGLVATPLLGGDDAAIKEELFVEARNKVLRPLWNAFIFWQTYCAGIDIKQININNFQPRAKLDRWVLSALFELTTQVGKSLDNYDLQGATKPITEFLDALTNWYIRRSRTRFTQGKEQEAIQTLYVVLINFCKVLAPFMPFITDRVYRELVNLPDTDNSLSRVVDDSAEKEQQIPISVHLTDWPGSKDKSQGVRHEKSFDQKLNQEIDQLRLIVKLGHSIRTAENIKVRQPLSTAQITGIKLNEEDKKVIAEELNVEKIKLVNKADKIAEMFISPKARALGPRLGKKVQDIIKAAKAGNFTIDNQGIVKVLDEELQSEEYERQWRAKSGFAVAAEKGIVVALDTNITQELREKGLIRDIIREVQEARKAAGLKLGERARVKLISPGVDICQVVTIEKYLDEITHKTNTEIDCECQEDRLKRIEVEKI